MAASVVILRVLSAWQPIPDIPVNVPVNPDAATYIVALILALGSGLFFGIMPVRQVMRADPWQVMRTGAAGVAGNRRFTLRDILLVVQIAICAVLVTSSLVAVRGLVRSLHSNFGFTPQNAMLVESQLNMAGYTGDRATQMQLRMIDAAKTIPGITAAAGPPGKRLRCLLRQHNRFPAHQPCRGSNELQSLPGLSESGRHHAAHRQRPYLRR
jgi:hypothetical protein